jgi:glycerophosphoryl diester phosphodiesterase
MASFLLALELGANAIETDVHLTRDGHVVVSHDPDGRRMADTPKEIRALTLEELAAWDLGYGFVGADGARPWLGQRLGVPTLEELIAATGDARLNIDLKVKDRALVRRTVAILREQGRLRAHVARELL